VPFSSHRSIAEGLARSQVLRMAEALFVRTLVDERLAAEADALVAVAGDFNDIEGSVVYRAVAGDATLEARAWTDASVPAECRGRALFACARSVPPDARFTALFAGSAQQIDHILVSRALWRRFRGARVLNETLRDDGAAAASGTVVLASDHAPICASFA
jgi:endonuclease/exonuclease/phosphatase family metal-dependent hydrolase